MKKFGIFAIAAAFAALGAFAEIERNTNSYVRAGVTYAQRGGMDAKTYVVTNVDTEAIVSPKRDKTDLKVYRKVKDIWRWTNWDGAKVQEPLAKDAPADFLALANSPGSEPIHFERGAWWGAVQFWPNGKVKYSQSEIPPGGTGELSTTVNFAMYAYDETGTNEIYRFGATATREDATNDTVVAWDETRNQYVRIATTDMVDESVKRGMTAKDGAARALPQYLHYMPFDDVYHADAAWYYEQAATNYVHGSCSARRVGGILERNYDWEFDHAPEFVIPVSGSDTRFASVGIANVGRLLTEDFVTSGKWSRYYRCLPGHTLDGVNENGVVAEINVVGGVPFGWRSTGDIHPLGAVRWALDNGTSAEMVATSLAVRVKFPAGWSQNFHYMIADAQETWIVENGAAHMVGTVANVSVMTNFRLFPTPDDYGDGQERYAILSNTANAITDAWFTRCYKRDTTPPWVSDLREVLAYTNAIYDAWAMHDREFFRDMAIDGKRWWQTVHTSVYDFEAKTLKVCVQESGDWYVFAVGGSGRVKSVNGKVGHVTLGPDDVNALPDDEERLVANTNFSAAVERVSPPVVLPEKWAFANVTNASGNAVNAADVGALSKAGDTSEVGAGYVIVGNPQPTGDGDGNGADTIELKNGVVTIERVPRMLGNQGSTVKINGEGMIVRKDARPSFSKPAVTNFTNYGVGGITRHYGNNEDDEYNIYFPEREGTLALEGKTSLSDVTNSQGQAVGAADVGALALSGGAMNDGATVTIRRQVNAEDPLIDDDVQPNPVSPTYIRTEISASGLSVKSVKSRGGASLLASINPNGIILNGGGVSIGSSTGLLGGSDTTYMNGKIVQNLRGGMTEIENALPEESGTLATREWVGANATPGDYANVSNLAVNAVQPGDIEAVNVVAEHYDATLEALWSVYITNGDMKFSVKTNEDTTAFREANAVLTDKTTAKKYLVGIDDGEMKFFTNEFGNPQ